MRIKSGIPGLDKLIQGGFEVGSLILLSGGTGTGKTIFCLQFIYEGAKLGENGLYITFEESKEDLIKDAKVFGWDFEKFMKEKKIVIKEYPPFAFDEMMNEFEDLVMKYDVKRVVVDSISSFVIYSKDPYEVRKKIYNFSRLVKQLGLTCIMVSEVAEGKALSRFGVEEFVADAVIALHYAGLGGKYDRTIQVVKMRRTNHARGLFPMRITDRGIEVSPEVTE